MEQRKIMSLGRSSLVISLPKHWVNLNDLKQGDYVSLLIHRDHSLVALPRNRMTKETREITVNIKPDEKTNLIFRKIIACYINGYFAIRLKAKNIFTAQQQEGIQNVAGKLYMRIMESNAQEIYIQTLIDESKVSIEATIDRMQAITVSMYNDTFNLLKKRDEDLAKVVYSRDDDVNHFYFFITRMLNSIAVDVVLANQIGFDAIECLYYQILVDRIEQVADSLKRIARYIIMLEEERQSITDSILELMFHIHHEVFKMYRRAVKVFFSRNDRASDVLEANKIIELQDRIENLCLAMTSKLFSEVKSPVTTCTFLCIHDKIKEIMIYAADIAEVAINRNYK